jgi:hypothetical protein
VLVLVVAVLGGLAAGWLRPPLGARSPRLGLQRLPLLAGGAVLTAVANLVDADRAPLVMGLGLAVLLGFVASNTHLTGVAVIGVGLLLNLVAVGLNGGMPVRGSALVAAGVLEQDELATSDLSGPRHLETPRDRLPVLGDVLPIPLTREVVSFGDLIVVFGAADAIRDLVRRRRPAWSRRERGSYASTMTQLSAVQDWGAAPSGAPDDGSQYSAKPDLVAPASIDLDSDAGTPSARPLVAASQSR